MNWKPHTFLAALLASLAVAGSSAAPETAKGKPIRALLVIGGCCHDYARQQELLKGVSERANVEWTVSFDPDSSTGHLNPVYANPEWSKGFDVVVHDECSADVKDLAMIERIIKPHRDGLPAVVLHCGMHSYRSEGWPNVTPWFEVTGLQTTGHGAQLPISVTFTDKESPITKGIPDWTTGNEELYNNSAGKLLDTAKPLARGKQVEVQDGVEKPVETIVAWTNTYKKTRVFATTLGHNNETVSDPRYLDLVTRGLLWSVNRLPK